MLLAELATVLREIEGTSERRRMVALLADLFRRDREDAALLPHLLQGRLGPPYASPDLGVDERRVALALAAAAGRPADEILRRDAELGDLGLVAEEVLPAAGGDVSVREAYSALRAVAEASGVGSAERKVTLLRDLLRRLSGPAARYVVRIATGRLRLGVADATVMDALSQAIAGNTSLRPRIEGAYSRCADLGLVAQVALREGPDSLDRIHPTPGRPILPALAERLGSPEEIVAALGEVVVEPKYDGLRLQAQRDGERAWIFTRRLEDVTAAFPEIAAGLRDQVRAEQVILDGEAVGYDPATGRLLPFQETARRRRKHGVAEMAGSHPLRYFAFDLLSLDGEDLLALPLAERVGRLRAIVREDPGLPIRLTPEVPTRDPRELERSLEEAVRQGLEGIMAKQPGAPYHAGARRFAWVKLKPDYRRSVGDSFDVVVVGYDRGRGRRARLGIGSLLCAVNDPARDLYRTVTRVGSGLSEEGFIRLREMLDAARMPTKPPRVDSLIVPDVWVEPRYVLEVLAAEVTRSPLHTCGKEDGAPGYALRFPRVVRIREDRRPEDATTVVEVIQAYERMRNRGADGTEPEES